jgi:hypothetical protein
MSEIELTTLTFLKKFPPMNGIEFPTSRPLSQFILSQELHVIANTAILILTYVCASVHPTAPQCNYRA